MKTHSPVPKKKRVKMDFYEALKAIYNGEKVANTEWGEGFYALIWDGFLCLHKPEGTDHQWIITVADIESKNYIIIK